MHGSAGMLSPGPRKVSRAFLWHPRGEAGTSESLRADAAGSALCLGSGRLPLCQAQHPIQCPWFKSPRSSRWLLFCRICAVLNWVWPVILSLQEAEAGGS